MRRAFRAPYFVVTLLFLAIVSTQILLAGLSLFWKSSIWEVHTGLGHLAPLFSLALLLLALVGRLPLRLRTWSAVLLVAVLVQTELFVLVRELWPAAASFHPLLAAVLLWGGIVVAQRSWALWRRPESVGVDPTKAGATAAPAPGSRGMTCPAGDPDCRATA